jgi:NADH dehydrogenase FAD-containing subunit
MIRSHYILYEGTVVIVGAGAGGLYAADILKARVYKVSYLSIGSGWMEE